MAFNRTKTSHGTKEYRQRRAKNIEMLGEFPVDGKVEIAYKFAPSESLGVVIEHDLQLGRLRTSAGGSHDPQEVTVFKKPT